MNLLTEFRQFIEQQKLFLPQSKLLLALSGGVDSMVLASMLKQSGYYFEVAHANFELRGDDSKADEQFVLEYCQVHKIPVHTRKLPAQIFSEANGMGIQEAARILRYQWFEELRQSRKLNFIVTAHHIQDQAETVIHHLSRGAGIRGLRGILPVSGVLCRPLLFATRQQILDYASTHAITWREDKSNEKDTYTRNYIRHHLLPHFHKIQPAYLQNLNKTSQLMTAADHYLNLYLHQLKTEVCTEAENELNINIELWLKLPYPEFVLYEWIHTLGFNAAQCSEILHAAREKHTGAQFLSQTHELIVDRNSLLLGRQNNETFTFQINALPCVVETEFFSIRVDLKNEIQFLPGTFWFDPNIFQLPLTLRNVNQGDKFIPLGMQGSVKVSDFLVNHKVSRLAKKKALVLASEEEILALLPYRISEKARVNTHAGSAVCIEVIKKEGAN